MIYFDDTGQKWIMMDGETYHPKPWVKIIKCGAGKSEGPNPMYIFNKMKMFK